jgi:hypothetical protein
MQLGAGALFVLRIREVGWMILESLISKIYFQVGCPSGAAQRISKIARTAATQRALKKAARDPKSN